MKRYISVLLVVIGTFWGQTKVDYPTQIKRVPIVIDTTYTNLTDACNAAAASPGELNITKQWNNVPTTTCNAVLNFVGTSARIEPANGAVFSVNSYIAPSRQAVWLVDTTGVVRLTGL